MPDKHEVGGSSPLEPTNEISEANFSGASSAMNLRCCKVK